MADIKNVFDIAARSMSAQMVRLNTVASNLANARSVASSEAEAYRAIKPVFKTIYAVSYTHLTLPTIYSV